MGKQMEADATVAQARPLLPEDVNLNAITRFTTEVYMNFWNA